MKELLARKTRQAKALSWAIIHFYSWGRDERQRDVLQLMEPIPLPTHREHRELWMCSGASHHILLQRGKLYLSWRGAHSKIWKKSARNQLKSWDSFSLGFQTIPVAFPMALAGQCHWQVSLPPGHSELLQHGLGDGCLNFSPSNLFYPLNFVFYCSSPADKLESPAWSPVAPHCWGGRDAAEQSGTCNSLTPCPL